MDDVPANTFMRALQVTSNICQSRDPNWIKERRGISLAVKN